MIRAARHRPILLVPLLLAVAGLQLSADPTAAESKALEAAQQSYQEGAFDLCSTRVDALLKKFPKTELLPQAELLQAKALYQAGRSEAALAALRLPPDQVPDNLKSDILFWQGEALLDLGKWPEAEQAYRAMLALKNPGAHVDSANLGLAWALFKQGREAEAQPLIQALIHNQPATEAGQRAQLLEAKIALSKKLFPDAIATLQGLLAGNPSAGLIFEANYWLGETEAAMGKPDQAVVTYQKVTGDPHAFPKTLLAQAYLGLGRARQALNQADQAALAYEQAYRLTADGQTQLAAFWAYLESARAAKQLPDAVAKLQDFAKSSDQAAPGALFAIGSVLAEDQSDDKAIGVLESLLVAYGKSPWIPAANYQLGLLYARTGKPAQAAKALQSCIDANSDPELVRNAHSQLGNVLLGTKDYAGAAAQFALILNGTDDAAENASYNFMLAQAKLGKEDLFAKTEADFIKRFPKSGHLKALALAEGALLTATNKVEDAKAIYQKAAALDGAGPDQKALLEALADLQYQTGDLAGTLKTCQAIVSQFPGDSLDAAQRIILVSYEMKQMNDDQVEQALLALAQKNENTPGAAQALFRLGEFYFYRQDYVKAQNAFQQLAISYPNDAYVDKAFFFAGRAAASHQDYTSARGLLEKVPDGSPLKASALVWDGRVSQQQLNFAQAIGYYNSALDLEKTGPQFVESNLLKGECYFEMGPKDADNYNLAIAAFDQIIKGKEGTPAERNEAAVRSAKSLEKLGKSEEAMSLYLDVLYGKIGGTDAGTPAAPDFSWQVEGGWQAARIREAQKDWRGAIEIYRQLEQIGGVHQQEFHDLINKLRRDNYIYE